MVHTHGIPMAVPHTRPVGMTAHATDTSLIGDTVSPFGRVQVPGSIGALLELRLGEAGHDAVGFAIHVPHYLAGSEWAEGALASLNAIVDVTGLNLPNDDLVPRARINQQAIASEVDDNDEARAVVRALEQQYDAYVEGQQRPSLLATEASQLPSADELGADFENFLRTVADDDHLTSPPAALNIPGDPGFRRAARRRPSSPSRPGRSVLGVGPAGDDRGVRDKPHRGAPGPPP